ncbi:unnamed protein product [Adineta steineri]|uniref:Uncharacterized protein n=2 Tax=Adineta steineri TaxID=433720 RepID=A0A815CZN0_9BILA|nr:unnamed protein product [Adineta steineri]CAF1290448.1 unnamed protein product [Adineta steineri]CAF3742901.1 unnamed protein product [Adineta steineri]CAF3807878.1 unnamed protein product [Adineta steineri]
MMMNLNETKYPFYSYTPSRYAAGTCATIVYISSIAWLAQSLYIKCRPFPLFLFVFAAYLTTFIELILRATLNINILNTKILYKMTAPLLSLSSRFLLLANYYCLIELRGKKPRDMFDRVIGIVVPITAVTADLLFAFANELSFQPNYHYLSFQFRQIPAGFILGLALFFYIIRCLSIPNIHHPYILPLLTISSTCVLIDAIYIQAMSIPTLFIALTQSELWFYICHLVPIVISLIMWSVFHPWRLLISSKQDNQHYDVRLVILRRTVSL